MERLKQKMEVQLVNLYLYPKKELRKLKVKKILYYYENFKQ